MEENHITKPVTFETESTMNNNNNLAQSPSGATQQIQHPFGMYQTDPYQSFQARLAYDYKKAEIDLCKNERLLQQRAAFEKRICDLRIGYEAFLASMFFTVYRSSSGSINYTLETPDTGKIRAGVLLNVKEYFSRMLISYFPYEKIVLEVTWGGGERIVFPFNKEGIDPKYFMKKLKCRGILFLVSGRTEKKAAEALLAYSISSAKEVELPYQYGWVMMKSGNWRFVNQGEETMRGILNGEK